MHCSQALLLMNAGKHVICRKAPLQHSREVGQNAKAQQKETVCVFWRQYVGLDPGLKVVEGHNLHKLRKNREASVEMEDIPSKIYGLPFRNETEYL